MKRKPIILFLLGSLTIVALGTVLMLWTSGGQDVHAKPEVLSSSEGLYRHILTPALAVGVGRESSEEEPNALRERLRAEIYAEIASQGAARPDKEQSQVNENATLRAERERLERLGGRILSGGIDKVESDIEKLEANPEVNPRGMKLTPEQLSYLKAELAVRRKEYCNRMVAVENSLRDMYGQLSSEAKERWVRRPSNEDGTPRFGVLLDGIGIVWASPSSTPEVQVPLSELNSFWKESVSVVTAIFAKG